ncbi:MAG: Trp family transcriptional regulator [Patescibacteria group bacterium]
MSTLQKEIVNTFFQTLEDIQTKEDFKIFCEDFFSDRELEIYTKRLAIAYWLKKKRSYENIKTNLKVTTSEIKLVESKLNSKGYKLALKKMETEEWANKWSEIIKKVVK